MTNNYLLAERGTFRAELTEWEAAGRLGLDDTPPAHRRVIRPLMALATEAFVFGLRPNSLVLERCADILIPARGKHALDLSQEVVQGYEPLWNSGPPDRGSIVAAMPVAAFDKKVFRFARRFFVIDNPNTSNSMAAVRYCRQAAKRGMLAFCFTHYSSQNVQMYGEMRVLQALYASLPKCKRRN